MQNVVGLLLFLGVFLSEKRNRDYFFGRDAWCPPRSSKNNDRCPCNVRTAVFILNMLGLVGWIIFDVCAMQLKYDELWDTSITMELQAANGRFTELVVEQLPDVDKDGNLAAHRRAKGDTYTALWTETYTSEDVVEWQKLADPATGTFNVTIPHKIQADGTCKTKSHTKYTPYNQAVLVGVVMVGRRD